jgi:hypothetical protein
VWGTLLGCETKLLKSSVIDDSVVVSIKPQVLFIQMAIAAQGMDNIEGIIRYSTMVLKEDNDNIGVLKPYIWTLLKHGASEDDVIGLLEKLYNMNDPKDLMYIGRAAKDCGALPLARKVLSMAQEAISRLEVGC